MELRKKTRLPSLDKEKTTADPKTITGLMLQNKL
jgi:hypothetical protein